MKKKMKVILSFVLAFVLTVGSVNASALFTKSVDEVKAGDLTEISWSDFGLTNGTTTNGQTYEYKNGDNLNNTSFEGDISIPEGSGFHYGSNNGWFGMEIRVSEGKLLLVGSGGVYVKGQASIAGTYYAEDYGMDTFADTRFTLKIEMYNLSSDKKSAEVNIYINGTCAESTAKLEVKSTDDAYKIDNKFGFANIAGGESTLKSVTVYDLKPTLKEITWTDFEWLSNGKVFEAREMWPQYQSGDTLNNTALVGDIVLPRDAGFRYAISNGWFGVTFLEKNGNLEISGTQGVDLSGGTVICEPKKYNLSSDTFENTRFTIRIELYNMSEDATSAKISIYINSIPVETEKTITCTVDDGKNYLIGNKLSFGAGMNVEGIKIYQAKPALTEIGWRDFGLTTGTTVTSEGITYSYKDADSLNNTAFTGDICVPLGSGFRYAVTNAYHGLTFKVLENGHLVVKGSQQFTVNGKAGDDSTPVYDLTPNDYGCTSFINQRFTIRIELYGMSENSLSAVANIYVNEKVVGTDISLRGVVGYNGAFTLNKNVGFVANELVAGATVYSVKPNLKAITWDDFELSDGTTISQTNSVYSYSEKSLNATKFVGDVSIPSGSGFRYAVPSSYFGLTFKESNGDLLIGGTSYVSVNGQNDTVFTCKATDYGLTTFTDERFTVCVELYDLDDENLNAVANIYINGKAVGTDIILQGTNTAYLTTFLGKGVGFANNELKTGVTVYKASNTITVPTDLTSLTWEEFGYTGSVESDYNMTVANYSASHLDTLVGTMFNGDVIMQSGREIRYAETTGKNAGGVSVKVNADGTLTAGIVNNGAVVKSYTVNGAYYGVDTFINTQFNLKIAVMTGNKVGVWVNGVIVGDLFETEAKGLTLGTTLYMVNAGITPISSRTIVPTGLTSISFDDWTAEGANKVSLDGKLRNGELCGPETKVISMVNTSFYEVVKFVDTNDTVGSHLLVYGGAKNNSWTGIRIFLDADGNMKLTSNVQVTENDTTNWVSYGSFTIAPQTAGVGESFRSTEFSWQIDTVQVGNHILLYMSFDGQLYNNAPLVFHDFADTISNAMHYNSYERQGSDNDDTYTQKCANCYTILGPSTKTLATLYHDLDKTATYTFAFAGGVKEFYQKDSKGEWVKQDAIPTGISETGDYKILFNDGVSDYIQEIVCYHYENDVDVTVLVRALKMKDNQTDDGWFDYETRLCDKNYDDKVDAEDIQTIRTMLLGTYKEDTSVMKISGFFSPTAVLIKDDTYATLKVAGVNHIIETDIAYTDDALARYRIYQELAYAQKYGLVVTVKDGRLDNIGKNNQTATADDVKRCVTNYKEYQSFDSLFICDEPKSRTFPMTGVWTDSTTHSLDHYKSVAEAIVAAGYKGWSNAFSMTSTMYKNTYNWDAKYYNRYAYYQYLSSIVDTYQLDFISSTFYPFSEDGLLERYFTTLAMLKDTAEKKNVSYRTFIQAGEAFEETKNLPDGYTEKTFTEARLKWNANMNLAFGTSALEYFPLVHPDSLANYADGSCASGLIDSTGKLTKFGEWATAVNTQAVAVDEILLNATNEGYMSTGGYAKSVATDTVESVKMTTGITSSEKITNTIHSSYADATVSASDTTYGAFTGCFEITSGAYAGKHAMYIVNYSDVNTNTITVSFGTSKEVTTIYQGVKTTQTGSTYTTTLAAGDAVLVVY